MEKEPQLWWNTRFLLHVRSTTGYNYSLVYHRKHLNCLYKSAKGLSFQVQCLLKEPYVNRSSSFGLSSPSFPCRGLIFQVQWYIKNLTSTDPLIWILPAQYSWVATVLHVELCLLQNVFHWSVHRRCPLWSSDQSSMSWILCSDEKHANRQHVRKWKQ